MASKDVSVLLPRTCDFVTLHRKEDYADVFKGMDLNSRYMKRCSTSVIIREMQRGFICAFSGQHVSHAAQCGHCTG